MSETRVTVGGRVPDAFQSGAQPGQNVDGIRQYVARNWQRFAQAVSERSMTLRGTMAQICHSRPPNRRIGDTGTVTVAIPRLWGAEKVEAQNANVGSGFIPQYTAPLNGMEIHVECQPRQTDKEI